MANTRLVFFGNLITIITFEKYDKNLIRRSIISVGPILVAFVQKMLYLLKHMQHMHFGQCRCSSLSEDTLFRLPVIFQF